MLGESKCLKGWLRKGFLQKLIQKKQWHTDHLIDYEETISLDGNEAEEPGRGVYVCFFFMEKPASIIHFDDVIKKCAFGNAKFCRSTRNRAFKM